jgi:hypothetical protein
MVTKQKQEVIFTRVRGLASVVWDPENNRMLAHFNKQGLLLTSDDRVIKRLDIMGYRQVSAADVTGAGLMLPDEKDSTRTPGKGYTHEGEGRPATAMPGADATVQNDHALFDPKEFPDGSGTHKRTLVE